MEVRFRPLPQSLVTRRAGPAQGAPEGGLNFLEIVESVTGAENSPEGNPNSSRDSSKQSLRKEVSDVTHAVGEEPPALRPDDSTSPFAEKKATDEGPLGRQIDMTA